MTRSLLPIASLLFLAAPGFTDDKPKPNSLAPKEIADGWIMLFDGETTFGWKTEGDVKVENGILIVNGAKRGALESRAEFPVPVELIAECKWTGKGGALLGLGGSGSAIPMDQWAELRVTITPEGGGYRTASATRSPGGDWVSGIGNYGGLGKRTATVYAADGAVALFRSIKLRPLAAKPLFNGKDLGGWKVFQDPKRNKSVFAVTKNGELSVKNGPGDLQTEKKFDNFVLQFECKTNGKHLNSGIFFRCIDNQYQNGYEAQIQNGFIGNDRTRPLDFGTGAIYRRVPARKVVSNDNEWFTMMVVANGPHLATWVNGYQTVDWTDDRKPSDNPRQGLRTAAGHLSIQGHDPTTDLLFRNIRIAELKK